VCALAKLVGHLDYLILFEIGDDSGVYFSVIKILEVTTNWQDLAI
jgi:hypothetical protein